MNKGGYMILDFKDNVLTAGTAKVIDGVYEALEGNYRKRVVLSGLVIGDTEYNDIEIAVTISSSNFVFSCYGYNFTIDDDDKVTATAITNAKSK